MAGVVRGKKEKEPGPYVNVFNQVIDDLWQFYAYMVNGSEWCMARPHLHDVEETRVPVKAMPVKVLPPPAPKKRPAEEIASAPPSDASSIGKKAADTPRKAPPPPDPIPKLIAQRPQPPPLPLKSKATSWADIDDAESRPPWINRPPSGRLPSVPEGGSSSQAAPKVADPRRSSVPLGICHQTPQNQGELSDAMDQGGSSYPLVALEGPKAPSHHPPPKSASAKVPAGQTWGPKQPSFPPPRVQQAESERPTSSVPNLERPKNRWARQPDPSRVPVPFLFVDAAAEAKAKAITSSMPASSASRPGAENIQPTVSMNDIQSPDFDPEESESYQTPDEAASDPPTPIPVSQVPKVLDEDITNYENYRTYVKGVVRNWLASKKRQRATTGPQANYEQNPLTSFLLMVLISSFLETAKSAAKMTYKKLYESENEYWYQNSVYLQIEELQVGKFCKHGRQGTVWRYLKTIGVGNFEPQEPEDIDGWVEWLTRDQLISVMEWCFEYFWKDNVDYWDKVQRQHQLHHHTETYYAMWKHLWAVQTELQNLRPPYPSGWTWEGYMKRVKAGLVEKAVDMFLRKIRNAESLAKLYTNLFERKIEAFARIDVQQDAEGLPADVVLQEQDQGDDFAI